jgi:hypothetical protein
LDVQPLIYVQFIKEKATYPFYSLLGNERYFNNETDTFFNEQKEDTVRFLGSIRRDIVGYEGWIVEEIIDDCKDDYNPKRK